MQLTLKILKDLPRGIFAQGTFIDSPEGVNIANTKKEVRWVAVRGDIHDWAVYAQNPYYVESDDPKVLAVGYGGVWDWEKIKREGDKIFSSNAKKLIDADEEAMKMYRS